MRLDTWDATAAVRYDQQLWNELVSLLHDLLAGRPADAAGTVSNGSGRRKPPAPATT